MPEIIVRARPRSIARVLGGLNPMNGLEYAAEHFPGAAVQQEVATNTMLLNDIQESWPQYYADKVRFLGYFQYGWGAENVPDIHVELTLLPRDGVDGEYLHKLCEMMAVSFGHKFAGLHTVAKAYSGPYAGFEQVNAPK